MKKRVQTGMILICLAAALCLSATGCARTVVQQLIDAAGENTDTGTGKPEAAPSNEAAGDSDASAPAALAGTRAETVWTGIYVYGDVSDGEIFAVTDANAQSVAGWYLYQTAAGSYGIHSFVWAISPDDAFTATSPFGNGSDQVDTYHLQNDRITVTYPDGWWGDRDYMYLCEAADAAVYVTHPSFDIGVLDQDPRTAGDDAAAGNTAAGPEQSTGEGPAGTISQPFYGVWVLGSHELTDCIEMVSRLQSQGYLEAAIFYTTDWSNLNTEPWYVVTAGVFATEAEADAALPGVQAAGYADAYVKYSGERQAYEFT